MSDVELLKRFVDSECKGSISKASDWLGYSDSHLRRILAGKRTMQQKLVTLVENIFLNQRLRQENKRLHSMVCYLEN